MKRAVQHIVCLLMACIVLISSTGFGLLEHTCQMRGKKVQLIGLHDPACKGCPADRTAQSDGKTIVKKADCCKEETRYENVDITSSFSQLFAKFIKAVAQAITVAVVSVITWVFSWIYDRDAEAVLSLPNAPPPAYGRALLAIVQRFLL
nr:hypothetical protein [uncultured Arsenicibacter sp.]